MLGSRDQRLSIRQWDGVSQGPNAIRYASRQVRCSRSLISDHCSFLVLPPPEAAPNPAQAHIGAVESFLDPDGGVVQSFLDPGDSADKLGLDGRDLFQGFEHGVVLVVGHGANPALAGLGKDSLARNPASSRLEALAALTHPRYRVIRVISLSPSLEFDSKCTRLLVVVQWTAIGSGRASDLPACHDNIGRVHLFDLAAARQETDH
jgi:hypothetical protein